MTFSKPRKTHSLITLALLTSFALSGCGIRGSLKTPPPIWGDGISAPAETPDETADDTANNTPDNTASNG